MINNKYMTNIEFINITEPVLNRLLDYYNEGERKTQRRKKFYQQFIELFITNQNFRDNYTEISNSLGVERKSIYRYFPSKADMLVDVAYLIVVYINEQNLIVANNINTMTEYDSVTKLKLIFRDIANHIIYLKEVAPFIQYFDDVFYNLCENDSAKVRYQELITEYKKSNHYLSSILEELRNEGKLVEKYSNDEIAEIFEQAFAVFVTRTVVKLNESDRYNLDNINIFIDIFLNGIIVDYEM